MPNLIIISKNLISEKQIVPSLCSALYIITKKKKIINYVPEILAAIFNDRKKKDSVTLSASSSRVYALQQFFEFFFCIGIFAYEPGVLFQPVFCLAHPPVNYLIVYEMDFSAGVQNFVRACQIVVEQKIVARFVENIYVFLPYIFVQLLVLR